MLKWSFVNRQAVALCHAESPPIEGAKKSVRNSPCCPKCYYSPFAKFQARNDGKLAISVTLVTCKHLQELFWGITLNDGRQKVSSQVQAT
jgi:hypothetical protein